MSSHSVTNPPLILIVNTFATLPYGISLFVHSLLLGMMYERKKPKTTAKKKSIRAPTALQLFKDERAQEIARKDSNDNEKASTIFNADQAIQDKYKEISEHISAELEVLKSWEDDMRNYDNSLCTKQHNLDIILPSQFEADEILKGNAQFLQSMQLFGTTEDEQKECFENKYKIFNRCNGLRLPIPQCGGEPLDLFALYRHVVLQGGFANCIRENVFSTIGRDLSIRGTDETLAYSLRIIYFKYLFGFEQDCQVVMIVPFNFTSKKFCYFD